MAPRWRELQIRGVLPCCLLLSEHPCARSRARCQGGMDRSSAHPSPALVWPTAAWSRARPRVLIPFEMLVVLVGDALQQVQPSPALELGVTSLGELQGQARGRAALALV